MNHNRYTGYRGCKSADVTEDTGYRGLVGLRIACDSSGDFASFLRITIVSDSQPALKARCHHQGGSELAVIACQAIIYLHRYCLRRCKYGE